MTVENCQWCNAPGHADSFNACKTCVDWECGSQRMCDGADLALRAGDYQSKACKQIVANGGWK